jgi:hypothetical protein
LHAGIPVDGVFIAFDVHLEALVSFELSSSIFHPRIAGIHPRDLINKLLEHLLGIDSQK